MCDISGVTGKVVSFSLVRLMSSFRVVTMVVLLPLKTSLVLSSK